MKSQKQSIEEFVKRASQDEIVDIIQSLLNGNRAGISGMKGESWLMGTGKPGSKKEAIASALRYCEIVNSEASKKIFQ